MTTSGGAGAGRSASGLRWTTGPAWTRHRSELLVPTAGPTARAIRATRATSLSRGGNTIKLGRAGGSGEVEYYFQAARGGHAGQLVRLLGPGRGEDIRDIDLAELGMLG